MKYIKPDAIFDGGKLITGAALHVKDGKVTAVAPLPQSADAIEVSGTLSPGLVDLQVNGGGGVLFNTSPTKEGIAAILAAHRKLGTTHLMPTVITDDKKVTAAACNAIMEAWGTGKTTNMTGLMGIHMEGPHISIEKRGTHNPEFIRPLDAHTLELAEKLRSREIPVLITLAPEMASLQDIATLAEMGVVVSIGHSNATAETVEAALDAGAKNFTHLYNAMSQMEGRAPGVVGTALMSNADIGIICDRVHVSDMMARLAFKTHGIDHMHLVSDAMPTVGGPDRFQLYGQEIRVVDGRLVNAEGNLAGAHTTMAEGVQNLVRHMGVSIEAALKMAITNPARVMEQKVTIKESPINDILVWDGDANAGFLTDLVKNHFHQTQ